MAYTCLQKHIAVEGLYFIKGSPILIVMKRRMEEVYGCSDEKEGKIVVPIPHQESMVNSKEVIEERS